MKARIKRFAVVQPIGKAPYKERADLDYRDNAELATQLTMYARSKWRAQRIDVDVHAAQIIVDGTPRANYSIHEYRPTTPGAGQ
ncbi:hypothetical protein SEA_POPPER_44 [Arthrobacter phage Popper]|uniref:Uncharacterized protein n=1 Tax=Arthrobacter phage Popper TaxID=2859633 RepID=A0AAE7WDA5_9CAUD|nr:hypothetical protein QEO78_gp62 [Arthrobacter phage Popper]QYC54961.1 hypothetical protein SEA_POPPER_44 [Arthrobacter phage Popper]WNM72263.1 hypothetical protein SEA_GUSANITA_43 [Arthrobacter phage Gusanita]